MASTQAISLSRPLVFCYNFGRMVKKIITEEECREEIKNILTRFLDLREYQVFVFGSRATGGTDKMSDWDIGIWGKQPLPPGTRGMIEEALEESDIPFRVDVVDFHLTTPKFKKVALTKAMEL